MHNLVHDVGVDRRGRHRRVPARGARRRHLAAARRAGVTHLAGAPTVLSMMSESPLADPLRRPLTVTTAGAPPSCTCGWLHVYGLTETTARRSQRLSPPLSGDPDRLVRRARRRGHHGGDRDAREHGDEGVFAGPGGDGRVFPRRLVPLRDLGCRYPDGYIQLLDRAKGHHHFQWREHLHHRGGKRVDVPSRGR